MKLQKALAVIGAGVLLFAATDAITYAATGSSLVLGKINQANAVTTIQNTGTGNALRLLTKSTATAPLVVNGKGKVTNLYADRAAAADNATKLGGKTLAQVNSAATSHLSWGVTGGGSVIRAHSADLTLLYVATGVWCATVAGISLNGADNAGVTATPITDFDATTIGPVGATSTHVEIVRGGSPPCSTGVLIITYAVNESARTSAYADSGFELTIIH